MTLDLKRFFRTTNPVIALDPGNPDDQRYYIDFALVRSGKIIKELERTVYLSENSTCQLFIGHIGCGKSTELLRLKAELEQQRFHVVYFESDQDLDMANVDISDILLVIARQVSKSLEQANIHVRPNHFKTLLQEAANLIEVQLSIPGFGSLVISETSVSLASAIGTITAKARDSQDMRSLLRAYTEPRITNILDAINKELLEPATKQLTQRGKQGLVVIVDNLDRLDNLERQSGRTQPEYLFLNRGGQLNGLACHVIYTIPLELRFSGQARLAVIFGAEPKMLPMVRVQEHDGTRCEEGIALLRQMVLARAFPDVNFQQRLDLTLKVFDSIETLDRLCLVSGGHVRFLLMLLRHCLQKKDPPIDRDCLESVIGQHRNGLRLAVESDEWELLRKVAKEKSISPEDGYQRLLRGFFVFEYHDPKEEPWFDINPVLAEAKELKDDCSSR